MLGSAHIASGQSGSYLHLVQSHSLPVGLTFRWRVVVASRRKITSRRYIDVAILVLRECMDGCLNIPCGAMAHIFPSARPVDRRMRRGAPRDKGEKISCDILDSLLEVLRPLTRAREEVDRAILARR
jgi:hypothetical protein